MGLVVDDIVDVVEEKLHVELIGIRPGLLGSAVIAGQATDVIDISHYLTQAYADWFAQSEHSAGRTAAGGKARILVVEDSEFFRHLLVPTLASAGYEVAAVSSAAQALRLHDAGEDFDAILSDIEMPDMNGIAFVRAVRAKGRWSDLPVIALTGHVAPEQIAKPASPTMSRRVNARRCWQACSNASPRPPPSRLDGAKSPCPKPLLNARRPMMQPATKKSSSPSPLPISSAGFPPCRCGTYWASKSSPASRWHRVKLLAA
jgi:CheY-like chemotaxis protein